MGTGGVSEDAANGNRDCARMGIVTEMGSVRILNDSAYDDERLRELVDFALTRTGGIDGSLAIRFSEQGAGGGYMDDRRKHRFPKWAGRSRFAVHVSLRERRTRTYPRASVCGHANAAGKWTVEALLAAYYDGQRKVGRWPIRLYRDRDEEILHTVAHELRHVIQFDRDRRSTSEVDCEEFAVAVLDDWQAEHPKEEPMKKITVRVVLDGAIIWEQEAPPSYGLQTASCPGHVGGSSLVSGLRRAIEDAEAIRDGRDPERLSEKALRLATS